MNYYVLATIPDCAKKHGWIMNQLVAANPFSGLSITLKTGEVCITNNLAPPKILHGYSDLLKALTGFSCLGSKLSNDQQSQCVTRQSGRNSCSS